MIWRSTAMIVVAFVAAWLTVRYSPRLMDLLGLGLFGFLGQLVLPILVLSALEALYRRISRPGGPRIVRYDLV